MKKIPKFLKSYFWDIQFEKLDFKKRKTFILKRILNEGNDKAIAWMFKTFKRKDMRDVLSHFRGFSKRSANYWALILGIPTEEVPCLRKHSLKGVKKLWPY